MQPVRSIAALVALCLGACIAKGAAEEEYQASADSYRLAHLVHYAELLSDYHEKTATYPFMGDSDLPTYVHLANDEQVAFTKPGPPYEHRVIEVADFFDELERGLGREVDEYYDPQYRPTGRPNFYVYMVVEEQYFFAVHFHREFGFASPVAPNYNKVELTNRPEVAPHLRTWEQLQSEPEFIAAVAEGVDRNPSMDGRERRYIDFSDRGPLD